VWIKVIFRGWKQGREELEEEEKFRIPAELALWST
jgi:hypothetical protein